MLKSHHHLNCSDHIRDSHILSNLDSINPFSNFNSDIKQNFITTKVFAFSFFVPLINSELFDFIIFVPQIRVGVNSKRVDSLYLSGTLHSLQMLTQSNRYSLGIGWDWIRPEKFALFLFLFIDDVVGVLDQVRTYHVRGLLLLQRL